MRHCGAFVVGQVRRLDAGDEVVGNADGRGRQTDAEDGKVGATDGAHPGTRRRIADAEAAEDGKRDCQPDGDRVTDDGDVDLEEEEADPAERWSGREAERRVAIDVEMNADRKVGQHRQQVGYGQPGQDAVRAGQHIGSGEDEDVSRVSDHSE